MKKKKREYDRYNTWIIHIIEYFQIGKKKGKYNMIFEIYLFQFSKKYFLW